MNHSVRNGYFLAMAAIIFWSLNLIIANYFATELMPFEIAFGRWLTASIIMLPFALRAFKKQGDILRQHWKLVAAMAFVGVVLDNTLVYYAGHTAPAADMGLLAICGPIFLILLSHFLLKTHIAFGQIVGLIIAVFGVITILIKGDFSQLSQFRPVRGDFIMLLNTFGFSVYSLMQSKRPKEISQISMLSVTALVGVIMIVPFMLFTVPISRLENINREDIAVMIYLGVFNSTLAYLCWNSALARLGNIKTAIIYYLLPIISGIEAYLFLGQKLFAAEIIGGLLIVSGITLVNLSKKAQS